MEAIRKMINMAGIVLSSLQVTDIIDILIVAFLIYKGFSLIRRTNSTNLARGLFVLLAMFALAAILKLKMLLFLLRRTFELGLIALVVLFQPELRRLFERLGSSLSTGREAFESNMDSAVTQTVLACTDMSESKTGALIIFERKIQLNDIMSTGTIINADATAELIKNIFFNKAPLHDGALVIRNGRMTAAGCVLPLTKSNSLSKDLGMRHRAGIGLSEQSDAVIVIVSEETGSISVAIEGMLKRHLSPATLNKLLRAELIPETKTERKFQLIPWIKEKILRVKNEK